MEASEAEEEPVEEYQTPNSKKKPSRSAKAAPAAGGSTSGGDSGMPSVSEVCSAFGLQDVAIDYSEPEFQSLTVYKLFQQHVRPILQKDNPKVTT